MMNTKLATVIALTTTLCAGLAVSGLTQPVPGNPGGMGGPSIPGGGPMAMPGMRGMPGYPMMGEPVDHPIIKTNAKGVFALVGTMLVKMDPVTLKQKGSVSLAVNQQIPPTTGPVVPPQMVPPTPRLMALTADKVLVVVEGRFYCVDATSLKIVAKTNLPIPKGIIRPDMQMMPGMPNMPGNPNMPGMPGTVPGQPGMQMQPGQPMPPTGIPGPGTSGDPNQPGMMPGMPGMSGEPNPQGMMPGGSGPGFDMQPGMMDGQMMPGYPAQPGMMGGQGMMAGDPNQQGMMPMMPGGQGMMPGGQGMMPGGPMPPQMQQQMQRMMTMMSMMGGPGRQMGQNPGPQASLEVVGNTAYVITGAQIVAINISNVKITGTKMVPTPAELAVKQK